MIPTIFITLIILCIIVSIIGISVIVSNRKIRKMINNFMEKYPNQ